VYACVVHLACSKPKDLGYAAELRTRSTLAAHVRREAVDMREVLLVHKEVAIENEVVAGRGGRPDVLTASVDEKPGVEAIANTAPDLPSVPAG
jgi:hypothetical protein